MPYTPEEWDAIVSSWGNSPPSPRTPRMGRAPTTAAPSSGRTVAVAAEPEAEEESRFARFVSGAADVARMVTPRIVRDAAGQTARQITQGSRFIDAIVPGERFTPGTDIAEGLERIPKVGGLVSEAFDIGLAPATLATAGADAGVQTALRSGGALGKLAAVLVSPASRSSRAPVRLLSETIMGVTGMEISEKVLEETDNQWAAAAAGIAGAVVAGGGLNAIAGAKATVRRPMTAAGVLPMGGRKFLPDLLPASEVAKEIDPAGTDSFGATGIGRRINSMVDPSQNIEGEVGIAALVFDRQVERGGLINEMSLQAAIDSHGRGAKRVAAPGGSVFDVDDATGKIKNVVGTPDLVDFVEQRRSVQLQGLRSDQRDLLTDVHTWLDELNDFRKKSGLKVFKNPDKELAHVTRIVRGIRDVDDVGRTNQFLERVHETRAQGIEAGVRYENDLRAIMGLMGQATYREAAAKQFDNMLQPLLMSPKQVLAKVRPEVVQARSAAAKGLVEARKEIRRTRSDIAKESASITGEQLRATRKLGNAKAVLARAEEAAKRSPAPYLASRVTKAQERVDRLTAAVKGAGSFQKHLPMSGNQVFNVPTPLTKDVLGDAKAAAAAAKRNTARNLESIKSSRVLPGYVFGRTERDIPVSVWKGKFLPTDGDFIKLAERMDTLTGIPIPVKINPFTKNFQQAADAIRLMSAAGDAAAPLVHGLPLLGQNPKVWARATLAQYRSFASPASVGRYVRANLETIQEMTRYGVPVGDVEQYIAATEGRGIAAPIHAFAGTKAGRQSLGRLEAGMDGFLTTARVEAWKSLRPVWDGTPDQLATYVRDLTGALSTKALGVGPNQRAFENAWLAFSPRLMRSTLALIAHAANPDTPQGRQAARSLLGLMAVGTLMATATNLAISGIKGENEDAAWKRVADSLDPTTSRFGTVEVGGQRIGVGGQVRAVAQFVAKGIANPAGFASAGAYENPLINYYMGRSAVGVNIAGGVLEAATDEKVNVLPYESVDSLPDLIKHLGQSTLPFALQSQLEARDLSKIDRAVAGLTSLAGFSANEKSPSDRINEEAMERYEKPYAELTGEEQQVIERDRADLFALRDQQRDEFGGKEAREQAAELRLVEASRLDDERALVDAYNRNIITPAQFRDEMKAVQRDASVLKRQIRGTFEANTADENKVALTAWYDTFDQAKIPGTEIVDWDAQEVLEANLLSSLTPSQLRYVNERRKSQHAPEAQWFFDNEDIIREAGYYDSIDEAFARFASNMPVGIDSYSELVLAHGAAVKDGDRITTRQLARLKSRVDSVADREKRRLRASNPELDRALLDNGRVTKAVARRR